MTTAFIFFVAWSAIGLITAAFMARRGHNFWLFAPMGLAYGPLTPVIAWAAQRNRNSKPSVVVKGSTWHADGEMNVLIGLDGTDAAVEAATDMLALLGPTIRNLHLVSVIDHQVGDSLDAFRADDDRMVHLTSARDALAVPNAELALLAGDPDVALADHAKANEIDLIVVGHRTRPIASALQGSTVSGLAKRGGRPILVMP